MARLNQLKMLLWKNFQIKRRMPVIFILETLIPFALFILLGVVRHLEPIKPENTVYLNATPVPSAGLAPMIQSIICHTTPKDGDGLPFFGGENSSYHRLLDTLDSVYAKIAGKECSDLRCLTEKLDVVEEIANIARQFPPSDSCKEPQPSNVTELLFGAVVKLQETFCGYPPDNSTNPSVVGKENNSTAPLPPFLASTKFDAFLMFWEKFLTGQLKVLYTPAKSQAVNDVIRKANRTLEIIDHLTEHAERWLHNTSVAIRHQHPDSAKLLEKLDAIDKVACWWLQLMQHADFSLFEPFDKEYEAVNYAINGARHDNLTVFGIIVFDVDETAATLPPHTSYKIRMNSTYLYSVKKLRPLYWSPLPRDWDYFYYSSGFMFLQDIIDRAIIDSLVGYEVVEPGTFTKMGPYPCYLYDIFLFTNSMILPLCMTISYVYATAIFVQNMVSEKENGLKEFMKVMGLSNFIHGLAWFITAFVQLTISVSIVTLILVFTDVLAKSDPVIIWLILEIYAMAIITFSFLVSSLFSKAKIASATAGMLYFLSYVPSMTIGLQEDFAGVPIAPSFKILACFLSTSAFGLSCKYIGLRESEGTGVQWDNIAISPVEHDSFSLAHSLVLLLADVFLYALLAWYIENIKPGDYGIPKPWYFPLTKGFWLGSTLEQDHQMPAWMRSCYRAMKQCFLKVKFGKTELGSLEATEESVVANKHPSSTEHLNEQDPEGLKVGVEIDNLTKVHDKKKAAVDRLSLKLYESQITGLLGHNGAGKTSTMSILTGILPPTSGSVKIYGLDIKSNLEMIRSSMGFCPQHNILFDHLTPEEHLRFYCGLKRSTQSMTKEDIMQILDDVGLLQKRSAVVGHLSGGMKRKLSIALAFLGNSKLVILDEPTAGVDPFSRRAIWELIVKYKSGRTILMSTHHMDEADALSDRIVVISQGSLRASGTSLHLRNNFCAGYHLVCVKASPSTDVVLVTESVTRLLPMATLHQETREEMHFVIPYEAEKLGLLANFFKDFQALTSTLKISSIGIYDSTLEEAYLRITGASSSVVTERSECSSEDLLKTCSPTLTDYSSLKSGKSLFSSPSINADDIISPAAFEPDRSCLRHFRHFRALMAKRFLYVRRSWKVLFSQIFLPAVFIATAMSMSLSASLSGDPEPFVLSPSQYNSISQPSGIFTPTSNYALKQPATSVTGKDGWIDAGATNISHTLHLISGLSASCVFKDVNQRWLDFGNFSTAEMVHLFNEECKAVYTEGVPLGKHPHAAFTPDDPLFYPVCKCNNRRTIDQKFQCPSDFAQAPDRQLITGDTLIDLGMQNATEYWLHTTDLYRLHRYGALQFGAELADVPVNFGNGATSDLRRLTVRRVALFLFDNRGYHAQPIYLNVVNNAILRANVEKRPELGNAAAYGITTYNHPLNGTDKVSDQDMAVQGSDMIIAVFVIIAMSFVPASFVVFIVYEKSLLIKHLQFMAGLNPITYWISNYVWDLLNYLIPATCCILILLIFGVPAYVAGDNLSAVIGLFMLYGWSMTPTMYPLTFVLPDPDKAYVFLVVLNLFVGTFCLITTALLDLFIQTPVLKAANDFLKIAFLPFPSYCLGRGMMDVALNHYKNQFALLSGQYQEVVSPLSWEVTLWNYVSMAIEGLVLFSLTIILEFISRRKLTSCKTSNNQTFTYDTGDSEDSDVAAERRRIMLAGASSDLLRIDNLSKEYAPKSGRVLAVDRLSVGMTSGECFGLLGLNGAGKSTTFSMLSGLNNGSSGEARLDGQLLCSTKSPSRAVLRQVGFCPQTDPLLDELTGREHLQLYARLHNVGSSAAIEKNVVDSWLARMGLTAYADKPSRTYSGGMKRKLSAALALLGNPKIILLDEPTTGMDPGSKRFLWDVILQLRAEGRLVVLTSHSMEECEALCSRLAVMVSGRLKCIGSTQQLKDKFGKGYTITLRLHGANEVSFKKEDFLQVFQRFNMPSELWRVVAKRHQTVELALLDPKPDLSQLFEALSYLRQMGAVLDFSVSQNNLESVFLYMANNNERHPSIVIAEREHAAQSFALKMIVNSDSAES